MRHLLINSGRPATPIGGDAIAPWVDVRHRHCAWLRRQLRSRRIAHEIRSGAIQLAGAPSPEAQWDRFSFPEYTAAQIQAILDALPPLDGDRWPAPPQ